jgi:hypothetical protein
VNAGFFAEGEPNLRVITLFALLALPVVPVLAEDGHSHHNHSHQSHSHDGHLGQGHAAWHDAFYKKLLRPDTKTSCCNLTDCRPTSGRMLNGHYEVKVNGAWISVPAHKIVKKSAPDLGFHVCAPVRFDGKPENIYCVVLPPET